jgi:hypothetical protein
MIEKVTLLKTYLKISEVRQMMNARNALQEIKISFYLMAVNSINRLRTATIVPPVKLASLQLKTSRKVPLLIFMMGKKFGEHTSQAWTIQYPTPGDLQLINVQASFYTLNTRDSNAMIHLLKLNPFNTEHPKLLYLGIHFLNISWVKV